MLTSYRDLAARGISTRVVSISYDTSLFAATSLTSEETFQELTSPILLQLKRAHIGGQGNRAVVWITHSLGGILTKQLLLADPGAALASATRGVLFFATPHRGSCLSSRLHLRTNIPQARLLQATTHRSSTHSRSRGRLPLWRYFAKTTQNCCNSTQNSLSGFHLNLLKLVRIPVCFFLVK